MTIRHASFETARVVRRTCVAQRRRISCVRVELDRVVHLGTGSARRLESQTNLDTFDGLYGHHRLRQASVELAIPLGMGAESKWQSFHTNFDNTPERIAHLTRVGVHNGCE